MKADLRSAVGELSPKGPSPLAADPKSAFFIGDSETCASFSCHLGRAWKSGYNTQSRGVGT